MKQRALVLAVIAATASGLHPLGVQTAQAVELEEVIVTARKRLELDQEVPIATTVFSASTIERAGIERPQDFIALTSNVSIVDTANAGDTQVTIRGITSTRDAEGTFAFVLDGVLITNPNGFNQELFDIQSIEVLKGPQGALYGRNAVSGAILINTKEPSSSFEGKAQVGAGTDGLVKGSVTVSGPLGDAFRGRLSYSNRQSDGEYENLFTGKDDAVDFLEEENVRGRLIWDATDRLTVDTQASYRKVEAGAINFNAVFALYEAAEAIGVPELFPDVNDHEFNFIFNVPGENEQENTFFSVKADYEMDWATLTTVFAYDDLEEYLLSDGTSAAFGLYSLGAPESAAACLASYNDLDTSLLSPPFYAVQDGNPPGSPLAPGVLNALLPPYSPTTCDGYQYQERNQESTSLEVRLTSDDSGMLRWVAGAYYAMIEREVVVSYGADLGDGYFGRQPYVSGRTDLLFWDEFDTDVYAVFGQLEFDLTENQTIALAARYDREEREVANKVPNVPSAQAFGGGAPINPAYDGSFTDTIPNRDETYTQFQPKVTWRWSFLEDASLYASYGVGFRSGGFNNVGSQALVETQYAALPTRPQNVRDDYDKEVSESIELGIKSEWLDRRLRVNAAVFRTEIEDNQFFNFLAGGFGILRVVTNIDEVVVQGFEIDVNAVLTDNLSAFGSLGLIDSEIKENSNRPYTEGNDAPLTPDSTANLGLQWIQPVFDGLEFAARLDWRYVGETWFSTVQDEVTVNAFTDLSAIYGPGFGFGRSDFSKGQRDAYDTVNLRLSLDSESWMLTAWGENITNEQYLEEVIPAPEFGGYFVHPAKGEAYGVDFVYRF